MSEYLSRRCFLWFSQVKAGIFIGKGKWKSGNFHPILAKRYINNGKTWFCIMLKMNIGRRPMGAIKLMICWYVVIERIYLRFRGGVYLKFRSLFEEPIGGLSSPQGLPRMSIPIAIIMSSWFWLKAKNEHYWFKTVTEQLIHNIQFNRKFHSQYFH